MAETAATAGGLTFGTITTEAEFAPLATRWDELVRAMPRPSPFLLHGWVREWWRNNHDAIEPVIHVAFRDGELVGALPLCVTRRAGLRVLSFQGGRQSALADLLVDGDGSVAGPLAERIGASKHDFANLYGLPAESRLVDALGPGRLRLLQRSEAPVLDLRDGWDAVYRGKVSQKSRSLHGRRRRQLERLGRLEFTVARTPDELEPALEECFTLHEVRWSGRPDGSQFATQAGRRFHRAALRNLAPLDVLRIVTMRLDGRPIAFHYDFLLEGRLYVHRLAFDPEYARQSPGLLTTLETIGNAAEEGATFVEFLGGAERYKVQLADRFEPLYEAIGLARTLQGRAAVAGLEGGIRVRKRLKQSPRLHRFYYEGLAPARRALSRAAARRRPGEAQAPSSPAEPT
jgi:CelD/BcsL family acetyltransferase involved in cellulose biosynthesis